MDIHKLHPELYFEEKSVRQLAANDKLLPSFCFSRIIKVFETILARSSVYHDLEAFWSEQRAGALAQLKDAFTPEFRSAFSNIPEILFKMLEHDGVVFESMLVQAAYHNDQQRKNYYVSSSFWNAFKEVSLANLRFQDLHRGSGYIFLPEPIIDNEGTPYHHYYYICGPIEQHLKLEKHRCKREVESSNEILLATLVGKDETSRVLGVQFPKDGAIRLAEYFQGAIEHTYTAKPLGAPIAKKTDYDKFTAQMLNLLAYIASGQPDISEFKNKIEYRGNSKTPANKHRHLSQAVINLIGFNWLKEKDYSEDAWTVRPHLRWQRYGENSSLVKLITVVEHTKQWRRAKDEETVSNLTQSELRTPEVPL